MSEQVITLRNGHSEITAEPLRALSELVPLAAKVIALAREDGSCLSRGQLPVLEDLSHDMRWVARNVYNADSLLINCETEEVSPRGIGRALSWVDQFTGTKANEKKLVIVNTIDAFLPRSTDNEHGSASAARLRAAEQIGELIANCTSAVVIGTTTQPYIHKNPLVSAFSSRFELPNIATPKIIEEPEVVAPIPSMHLALGSSALSAAAA